MNAGLHRDEDSLRRVMSSALEVETHATNRMFKTTHGFPVLEKVEDCFGVARCRPLVTLLTYGRSIFERDGKNGRCLAIRSTAEKVLATGTSVMKPSLATSAAAPHIAHPPLPPALRPDG